MTRTDKAPRRAELAFLIEAERAEADFRGDVLKGLAMNPPCIPAKYFYDERGAALFEAITRKPEYYVTDAELGVLTRHAHDIADRAGPDVVLMEPGSGAARKLPILLDAFERPAGAILFDISKEQLQDSGTALAAAYPSLTVGAVVGDFSVRAPFETEEAGYFPDAARRVVFFPGSTLGNFEPAGQIALLRRFAKNLRPGDAILLGVDRIKDAAILDAAYDDAGGVTAAFNLNLLHRMQHELGADLRAKDFAHRAFYRSEKARVEMHLLAVRDTVIRIGEHHFRFRAGEAIHTENSHKFDRRRLNTLADASGLRVDTVWGEADEGFLTAWLTLRG